MADDEFNPDSETNQYAPGDLRRQLEEAKAEAKAAKALQEENNRLREDLAFRDAGLSLNDLQRKALLATHDGELKPEALKATAETLGFVQAPASAPVQDDPSLAVHSQIAADAAGAESLSLDREAEIDQQLAAATTEEEVLAIYRSSGRPLVG